MKAFNFWLQRSKTVARIVVQECTTVCTTGCVLHKDYNVYLSGAGSWFDGNIADKKSLGRAALMFIKSTIVMATTVTGRAAVLAALSLQQPTECNFPSSLPYECHYNRPVVFPFSFFP